MTAVQVLLTGGHGYIGSQVLARLSREGIDHVSVDKQHASAEGRASLDLCDRAQTIAFVRDCNPSLLVHCGTNSALAYKNDMLAAFREDAAAMCNLLEALHSLPDCRLVFFSSSYVYSGISSSETVTEDLPLAPSHNFGVAKLFFEQLILRTHPNSVIFRLSSVFGPGNALHPNAVLAMAQECMERGRVTVWGAGKRMMQYVAMSDVVHAVMASPSLEPGIYNLGGDAYVSTADAAGQIAAFFNAKVTFLHERQEGETLPFMDNSRLKQSSVAMTPFGQALPAYLALLGRNAP